MESEPKKIHDMHERCFYGIRQIAAFTAALSDPEVPGIGEIFNAACRATGVTEAISLRETINAAFRSFVLPPKPGQKSFTNQVVYGGPAFDVPGRLFAARTHECIHAMQYKKAAVMHADPFNPASPFFLTPEDYVRRKELLEADAYAKGAWLQSLSGLYDPATQAAIDHTPLSAAFFERARHSSNSLQEALEISAVLAGDTPGLWIKDEESSASENTVWLNCQARDMWHRLALQEYKAIIAFRRKEGEGGFALVRMEDADIREIGTSFGPNPFEKKLPPLELSAANRKLLDEINQTLQSDLEKAETLSCALERRGMTRQELIESSYKYRGPEKQEAPALRL